MTLESYVIEERGDPSWNFTRLLVLLHGFAATERDFTPVGPLLDPDGHYLVCGLRGPLEADGGGRSWTNPVASRPARSGWQGHPALPGRWCHGRMESHCIP